MQKNRSILRSTTLLTSCATFALLSSGVSVIAQNTTIIGGSGSSGVYVNEQLIGSVPAYANAYAYGNQSSPGYGGVDNQFMNRPGNLLFPPENYPHSQITINSFADFKGSGYTTPNYATHGNNQPFNGYSNQYTQNPYAQNPNQGGAYPQQPGQTSGSSLYNPYGQPLVPLSQVSNSYVANAGLGSQPQYPTQVPAFSPQSQLLVPPPAGGSRVVQNTAPVSTPAPKAVETASRITPPAAPKVVEKKAEPVNVAPAPSSIIPPAPIVETTEPTKVEPVATAPAVIEQSEAPVSSTPPASEPVQTATTPAPAPVIEPVSAEPVLAPPPAPAPAPSTSESIPAIPTAPVIAAGTITESTEELAPPPPPPTTTTTTTTTASVEPTNLVPVGELGPIELTFEPSEADLSPQARAQLENLADILLADETQVIQLLAYAGDNESNAQARRVSLSRALAVRGVLMERGILSTRMHVRALGNKAKKGNPDRVEIIPVQN